MDATVFTPDGLQRMNAELERLATEGRHAMAARLQHVSHTAVVNRSRTVTRSPTSTPPSCATLAGRACHMQGSAGGVGQERSYEHQNEEPDY
jgi:hypothetical protein